MDELRSSVSVCHFVWFPRLVLLRSWRGKATAENNTRAGQKDRRVPQASKQLDKRSPKAVIGEFCPPLQDEATAENIETCR